MDYYEHHARNQAAELAVRVSEAVINAGGHITASDVIATAEAIYGFIGHPEDVNTTSATNTTATLDPDDIGF